jgi:alpha-amylase
MSSVVFYFQVHQPYRLKRYRVFDIGKDHHYFNDTSERDTNNRKVFRKVADKCYLPANATWLELLKRYPKLKISYSLSGVFMEQMEEWGPDVLESFKKLVATGQVEILDETYDHSLAFLYSKEEFVEQVRMHRDMVKRLFHVEPTSFRNTELIYHNDLAEFLASPEFKKALGVNYRAVIAEGADHVLGWRSPNFLYQPPKGDIKLMLKNYRLSDDIAFRFSSREWKEWPLTAPKFANWVHAVNGNGNVINLFMDYETFGEHQWEDTGIFDFLRALPEEILKHPDNDFLTVTEAAERYPSVGTVDVPHYMSWADVERDLSAWLGNGIQHDAIGKLFALRDEVLATGNRTLIDDWRKLTTSDHFYYMCTKWFNDGDVHKYFSPYETPYDAFIAFSNVIQDMRMRLTQIQKTLRSPFQVVEVVQPKVLERHAPAQKIEETPFVMPRIKEKEETPLPAIAETEEEEEDVPLPVTLKLKTAKRLEVHHEGRRSLQRKPRKT